MTELKSPKYCIGSLALLGFLAGCGSVRPQPFRTFFLPPASAPKVITAPPPEIAPAETWKSTGYDRPSAVVQIAGRGTTRTDALIREAEWHFEAGRKAYRDGDVAEARHEFDRAVDLLLAAPGDASGSRTAIDRKLEELIETIHRFDLAHLGVGDTGEPVFEKSPLEDIPQMTFPIDPSLKTKVLDEVRATTSQLPLEVNDAVLSYVNYFASERGRKILLFGLRRAGRYKPLIQRILDEEGVPQELIFVAQAESAFRPRAVSRKRAVGMWQFVRDRGRQYGLVQTQYTDERLDPERATRAAARHLRDLYQRYGDWYLALAGYNAGPGVVDRAVERTGYADFWEFRRRSVLPRETANYVPIVLAMTIMVKNAREYDLENVETDPPLEYDTLELSAPAGLALVAGTADCPVSQIRELNPALLRDVAPAGLVRVPKGSAPGVIAVLETIPAEKRLAWRAHRVGEGETLASIARQYRVAESAIAAVNTAMSAAPQAGELLIVPAAPPRVVTAGRARRGARRRATTASARRPVTHAAAAKQAASRKHVAPAKRAASAKTPRRGAARASVRGATRKARGIAYAANTRARRTPR